MNSKPYTSIKPEYQLADRFLMRIPRSGVVKEEQLKEVIDWNSPTDKDLYKKYYLISLNILINSHYVEKHPGVGLRHEGTTYSLTDEGRDLKDNGGYINHIISVDKKESFNKKVHKAEGEKKLFDNKAKVILFALAILAALGGLWGKCNSDSRKHQIADQNQPTTDSSLKQTQKQSGIETTSVSSKRHHKKNNVLTSPIRSNPQTGTMGTEKKDESPPLMSLPKPTVPLQVANADNIEFKLLSAEGSTKAQTIKMTVLLTTSAANWHVWSDVHSIIDQDGNEYKVKSFTNGASSYDEHITLNTGVPIKCTYTFGGILSTVKNIKLFKFEYRYKSLDDPTSVEFRDIPINWK